MIRSSGTLQAGMALAMPGAKTVIRAASAKIVRIEISSDGRFKKS
jgi:hypothetical protein